MKISRWQSVALAISLTVATCSSSFASAKIFSGNSYSEAKELAKKDGKYLLIDFTASWCGPCRRMEATTWSDPTVEKWVKENAVAVQIDVDKDKKTAAAMKISAMPTVIVFSPKDPQKEYERQLGYQDPKDLLEWLNSIKDGKRSIDKVKDKAAASFGKGGSAEVEARYTLARELLKAEEYEPAAEQFVWLWQNMAKEEPASIGVRMSYMASDMAQLAAKSPAAAKKIEELRTSADTSDSRADWVVLNKVLGDDKTTLAWFDKNKNDAKQREFIVKYDFMFSPILAKNDRWMDLTNVLYSNPDRILEEKHKMAAEVVEHAHLKNPFPREAATIYTCYLAAGRDADAEKVAEKSLQLDNSSAMREALAATASQAGQVRPSQLKWIDELIKERHDNPILYCFRAEVCFKLKQYDEALKGFDTAISLAPNIADIYAARAEVYEKMGKHDLAEKDKEMAKRTTAEHAHE